MELWQKIFICTLILVILAVDGTALLLLSSQHQLLVNRERSRAMDEHAYFAASVRDKLVYTRLQTDDLLLNTEDVTATMQEYLRDSNVSFSSIYAYRDGEEICSSGAALRQEADALAEYAAKQSSIEQNCVQIIEQGGRQNVLAASTILLEGWYYQIVTVSDITQVFQMEKEQIQYVQWLSVACATMIAGILLLVVWTLLRPLRKINEVTWEIARGNYQKRLRVRGYDELSELADNMNRMAEAVEQNVHQLEQVAEDRKTFIANLAHEMKTPLTSILGFADILRVKRMVSNEERQDYANVIVQETRRLRALSGKLMELITMGSTKLDFVEVSLSDFFREVEYSLSPLITGRGLKLIVSSVPGTVRVDQELMKSLLYNLVDNAAKASPAGKTIELRSFYREDKRLVFSVKDEGMGIPQRELDQIVKPFYMLDKSRSRKAGGAGLGLPLCVEIAHLHGAALSIQSTVGKGTLVTITFGEEDS